MVIINPINHEPEDDMADGLIHEVIHHLPSWLEGKPAGSGRSRRTSGRYLCGNLWSTPAAVRADARSRWSVMRRPSPCYSVLNGDPARQRDWNPNRRISA